MNPPAPEFFAIIAGDALRDGVVFPVQCNCGGQAPVTPPLSTRFVICPNCLCTIRLNIMEGDPGFLITAREDGEPIFEPVQGSKWRLEDFTEAQLEEMKKNARQTIQSANKVRFSA
jgi:hypothetical protein